LILEAELSGHHVSHVPRVEHAAVADLLRPFHRRLGVLQQRRRVGAVVRKQRAPTLMLIGMRIVQPERMTDESLNSLFEQARDAAFLDSPGQDDSELVRADPCQEIRGAYIARQPVRHLSQEFVAGLPAEAVVDVPEPVQIDEEQRQPVPPLTASRMNCAVRRETGCGWRAR
jgi:hypothetical protein